jgi:ribulose-5-phosphate 4-epimerase/fuculose-1-phosphate aldolase
MSDRDDLARLIVTAGRIMDGMKLTEGFGHMSARLPEKDRILITGALAPGLATTADLLEYSVTGECLVPAPSGLRPALEIPMHLAIYRARSDVRAICRTHSPHVVACGAIGRPIRATHGFGGMLGLRVGIHAEVDLIIDATMGDSVARALGLGAALLLRGNGAVTVGASIEEAVVRAIFLEESARHEILGARDSSALTPRILAQRAQWYANEIPRAWHYYSTKFGDVSDAAPSKFPAHD